MILDHAAIGYDQHLDEVLVCLPVGRPIGLAWQTGRLGVRRLLDVVEDGLPLGDSVGGRDGHDGRAEVVFHDATIWNKRTKTLLKLIFSESLSGDTVPVAGRIPCQGRTFKNFGMPAKI